MRHISGTKGRFLGSIAVALLATATARTAGATENGGSIYPNGVENFLIGAVPPPGFYPLVYGTFYTAGSLRNNDGDDANPDFSLTVEAIVPRFVWVTPLKLGAFSLTGHIIIPVVNVDVTVAPEMDDAKFGLGDITFGPGLGHQIAPGTFLVFAVDVNAPTGAYNAEDIANVGRNYWNLEPLAIVTHVDPKGLNADLKVMYDFNFRNPDTEYLSGQELHADYSIGWGFAGNWVAGVGGYVYQQVTDDNAPLMMDGPNETLPDRKGRAFAVGPAMVFNNHKGFFVTAKYEFETAVRNRPQGSQLWLKTIIPF